MHHQGSRRVSGPFFVILFTTITITGARDMSRAFSFFLFILFYFILHRGRDASWALVCFILFLFYSFYVTGTEMCLSLFFFVFCYRTFYFTRARVRSSNLNQSNGENQLMFLASFFSEWRSWPLALFLLHTSSLYWWRRCDDSAMSGAEPVSSWAVNSACFWKHQAEDLLVSLL